MRVRGTHGAHASQRVALYLGLGPAHWPLSGLAFLLCKTSAVPLFELGLRRATEVALMPISALHRTSASGPDEAGLHRG